ncbi:hypothetical protein [Leisingera methylohalidivorans]|uniref:hypothetical protein n=1 Tax=Leisingera methylohalidivorans TaxID=133924 RepID=UPI0012EB4241|nr:hypothetical protein [Leisingera methylohalidivorans]
MDVRVSVRILISAQRRCRRTTSGWPLLAAACARRTGAFGVMLLTFELTPITNFLLSESGVLLINCQKLLREFLFTSQRSPPLQDRSAPQNFNGFVVNHRCDPGIEDSFPRP